MSDEPSLPAGWQTATYHKMQQLRVFATPAVVDAASRAYTLAFELGEPPPWNRLGPFERDEDYDAAELVLHNVIRTDLGVDTGAPPPAPDGPDATL